MKIDSVAGAYLSCKPSFSPRGVVEASLSMPGLVPGVAERQSLVESGAANRFSGPQSVAVRLHGRMAKQAYSQRRTPEVSESRLEPCALDAAASSQLGSNFSPRQRHGSVQEARLEPGRDVAPRSYGSAVAVAACRGPRERSLGERSRWCRLRSPQQSEWEPLVSRRWMCCATGAPSSRGVPSLEEKTPSAPKGVGSSDA